MKTGVFFVGLSTVLGVGISQAAITFTVTFTLQAQSDLSVAEQALFTDGLAAWDDIIDGHRDGAVRPDWDLMVDTFSAPASGGGVTLGTAGPSGVTFSNVVPGAATSDQRFIISTGGNANFNVHPDAGALQAAVIKHEIGHALGIGTLWEDNEVYNDGDGATGNRTLAGGTPGQYMGAAGLAAYQVEFDAAALFIPVELDGGGGTANGHWNEVTDNFSVENSPGFDSDPGDGGPAPNSVNGSLDDELMTGVLGGSPYLSNTTIQHLFDIGFNLEPIPEPSSGLLLGAGFVLLGLRRRR